MVLNEPPPLFPMTGSQDRIICPLDLITMMADLHSRSPPPHVLASQLLVREPYAVMQSFAKVLEPTQQELGYTVC